MVIDICTNTFTFDDKMWITIRKLLFRPGFLSKEYVSGRIVPYTLPIKILWIAVLVFTVVFSFYDTVPVQLIKEGIETRSVISDYFQYLPYFMLLIIPIFTALLMLFFRKERYAFSEHLVFAIHLHTIIFFLFTIEILVSTYLLDEGLCLLIFLLFIGLYTFWSAIKFYHTRRKRSVIWRMLLIGLLYFIISFILLTGIMIFISWYFGINTINIG